MLFAEFLQVIRLISNHKYKKLFGNTYPGNIFYNRLGRW